MIDQAVTRAFALAAVGDMDAALAEFQHIQAERPHDADAHYNVGLAQTELGQMAEARRSYIRSLKINRRHVSALHNLALVELRSGRHKRAATLLCKVLDLSSGHPRAAIILSDIYASQHEWAMAQELLSRALAVDPTSLPALTRLGNLRRLLGDEAGAARVFAEAVRLHPGEMIPQSRLGESLRWLADPYRNSGEPE